MLANDTTNNRLAKIREAERAAHTKMYSSDQVLSINSWLQKTSKSGS